MEVFRITKKKYKNDLSGKGAELFGGRWNPMGTPALYTSENRALCALEILVYTPKEILPPNYIIQTIHIPEEFEKDIVTLAIRDLPLNWDTLQYEQLTESLGLKSFKDENKIGLRVPSVIIKQENNIVLNPLHQLYKKIKVIEEIEFFIDKRLLRK